VIRFKIEDDREIVWNDMVRADKLARQRLGRDMVIARASVDGIGHLYTLRW